MNAINIRIVGVLAAATLAALLPSQGRGEPAKERSPLRFSFEVDGQKVEITVKGGEVSLLLDGERMPKGRFTKGNGWYQLLDRYGSNYGNFRFDPYSFGFNFTGLSDHAWLGVDLGTIGAALAEHLDLDADAVGQVIAVTPSSPAEKAGLKKHDIMVQIDGQRAVTTERLRRYLGDKKPGETITATVLRKGKLIEVEILLGRSPGRFGFGPFNTALGLARENSWNLQTPRFDNLGLVFDQKEVNLPWSNRTFFQDGDKTFLVPRLSDAFKKSKEKEGEQEKSVEEIDDEIERLQKRLDEVENLLRSLREKKKDN